MTNSLDAWLSGRYQACTMNYNHYLKPLFGDKQRLDELLTFSIQFLELTQEQLAGGRPEAQIPQRIRAYIVEFDGALTPDEFNSENISYRMIFCRKLVNRPGQADAVVVSSTRPQKRRRRSTTSTGYGKRLSAPSTGRKALPPPCIEPGSPTSVCTRITFGSGRVKMRGTQRKATASRSRALGTGTSPGLIGSFSYVMRPATDIGKSQRPAPAPDEFAHGALQPRVFDAKAPRAIAHRLSLKNGMGRRLRLVTNPSPPMRGRRHRGQLQVLHSVLGTLPLRRQGVDQRPHHSCPTSDSDCSPA